MHLKTIIDRLDLGIETARTDLSVEVSGAYVSDLLSDVMANGEDGQLWLTLQVHPNIVAVATLKNFVGIVLVNSRKPEVETLRKAEQERIAILSSPLQTFPLSGRLYQLFADAAKDSG